MYTFTARGPSEGLFLAKQALEKGGKPIDTRNGTALEFDSPVLIHYTHPKERVIFYKERDANPFFHLMEALWMLAGRRDVKFVDKFNGRIKDYSDDGKTFHGAYGYRWRKWFKKDQLDLAVERLSKWPNDRRTVLSMWDANTDLIKTNEHKDLPCNTAIYFKQRNNKLDITVTNRSNDLIWGTFGANVVHMSILQEYMAARLGCQVGSYYHFTNNLHAYVDVLAKIKHIKPEYDPYLTIGEGGLSYKPPSFVGAPHCFDEELQQWFRDPNYPFFANEYLFTTCSMVRESWKCFKEDDLKGAFSFAEEISDRAWQKACIEWLTRREIKRDERSKKTKSK
jgi:thymidylate synthase